MLYSALVVTLWACYGALQIVVMILLVKTRSYIDKFKMIRCMKKNVVRKAGSRRHCNSHSLVICRISTAPVKPHSLYVLARIGALMTLSVYPPAGWG